MFAGQQMILNLEKKYIDRVLFRTRHFFKKFNKFMLILYYIYLATQNNIILTKLIMFCKLDVSSKGIDVNMLKLKIYDGFNCHISIGLL